MTSEKSLANAPARADRCFFNSGAGVASAIAPSANEAAAACNTFVVDEVKERFRIFVSRMEIGFSFSGECGAVLGREGTARFLLGDGSVALRAGACGMSLLTGSMKHQQMK